jgi:hypothetical protein
VCLDIADVVRDELTIVYKKIEDLHEAAAVSLFDPGERCERRFLRKGSSSCADVRWNPIGERHFFGHVASRTRVDLRHTREVNSSKLTRRSDKSRPQPPMDKRDLPLDQPTHEDIVAVADRSRYREDLMTLRMRPPATSNRLSRYDLHKRRDRPSRGLKHDAVFANESKSQMYGHSNQISIS